MCQRSRLLRAPARDKRVFVPARRLGRSHRHETSQRTGLCVRPADLRKGWQPRSRTAAPVRRSRSTAVASRAISPRKGETWALQAQCPRRAFRGAGAGLGEPAARVVEIGRRRRRDEDLGGQSGRVRSSSRRSGPTAPVTSPTADPARSGRARRPARPRSGNASRKRPRNPLRATRAHAPKARCARALSRLALLRRSVGGGGSRGHRSASGPARGTNGRRKARPSRLGFDPLTPPSRGPEHDPSERGPAAHVGAPYRVYPGETPALCTLRCAHRVCPWLRPPNRGRPKQIHRSPPVGPMPIRRPSPACACNRLRAAGRSSPSHPASVRSRHRR